MVGPFGEVLVLCAEAGLVRVGVIAVDGTKVAANAAPQATRDYQQIVREILARYDLDDLEASERDILDGAALAAAELPEPAEGEAPPGAYTCC